MTKVESGNTVSVHYNGTLNNGTEFDNSHTRGEPITFQVGSGQVIPGFDVAVTGMTVGETKEFSVVAAEAYGARNDAAVQAIPVTQFPEGFEFTEGSMVSGQTGDGQQFQAKIVTQDTHTVTLDFNHPLAGEDLNFKIELMSIS